MYHIVLSGSGSRFACFIGGFKYIQEHVHPGFLQNVGSVVGTSGGAFVALLVALGFSLKSMEELCISVSYEDVRNLDINCLLAGYGVDNGARFVKLFKCIIARKLGDPNATFADLFAATSVHLKITATNVTHKSLTVFDHMSHPDTPLWLALRASISLPLLFTAVEVDGDIYSDGGLLCSMPVRLLGQPSEQDTVVGFNLEFVEDAKAKIDDLLGYLLAISQTMYSTINRIDYEAYNKQKAYELIKISTATISPFNLNVNQQIRTDLMQTAYSQTELFYNQPEIVAKVFTKSVFAKVLQRARSGD